MFSLFDKWKWVGGLFFGIYFLFIGYGVLPRKPKNAEAHALWRKKFGFAMKLVGLITLFFSIAMAVSMLKSGQQ
jgi:hypothetical protein